MASPASTALAPAPSVDGAAGSTPGTLPAPRIHPTAIVDPRAVLHQGVVVGPNCVITGPVELGESVELMANVYLQGPLKIGPRTRVWPGVCVGTDPQDYKVKPGFPTAGVVIGSDCLLREGVTVHAATKTDAPTRIGDRVFMMVNSHAGHDAQVGNDCILVNGALLAGHVSLGDRVTVSGQTGVHQFCRVGRFAFLSGMAAISADVPPFCVAYLRNTIIGLNLVGMRRNGFSREEITLTRQAFREVFKPNLPRPEAVARLTELAAGSAAVQEMLEFVRNGKKPLCRFNSQTRAGASEDMAGE